MRSIPLWPAYRLPLKVIERERLAELPISPLAGEMSGRTEGGAVPPAYQPIVAMSFVGVPLKQAHARKLAILPTPLCPTGHLPRKGGDRMALWLSPISKAARQAFSKKLSIPPFGRLR
ncbi:hypothetical protein MESS4_530021 [Mesorhizobium sp. STM 4661]|nr:hypothetical protein MESS4_530021 [Mesorhizobium sp. STM 4661]